MYIYRSGIHVSTPPASSPASREPMGPPPSPHQAIDAPTRTTNPQAPCSSPPATLVQGNSAFAYFAIDPKKMATRDREGDPDKRDSDTAGSVNWMLTPPQHTLQHTLQHTPQHTPLSRAQQDLLKERGMGRVFKEGGGGRGHAASIPKDSRSNSKGPSRPHRLASQVALQSVTFPFISIKCAADTSICTADMYV